MPKDSLALLGGEKTIKFPFNKYNTIGDEEIQAVNKVLESGNLSSFLGCWDKDFYGGPKVKEFEKVCSDYFQVKYAITTNSWTSGLVCSLGAINIEPGDEVIVTPWTMCASATAILHWNAIPVFADIEPLTFNLDPDSVLKNISKYTKAIIAADIFGHSCNISRLRKIADENNLYLITDTAQSPGANNGILKTGTSSDVGGFSLNYHKHIHTGEGGILITNNDQIAEKLYLIRNHGEAVVEEKGTKDITNIIGHNFRLGEIESAIGIEQFKKLDKLVESRKKAANFLNLGLSNLKGLKTPFVAKGISHAFYIYGMTLDIEIIKVSRETIILALEAEGLEGLINGYQNIHLLPMYQKKIAYGRDGFPWSSEICKRNISYKEGICPVAENLHSKTFLGFQMCLHELGGNELELIVSAFQKVWANLNYLQEFEKKN